MYNDLSQSHGKKPYDDPSQNHCNKPDGRINFYTCTDSQSIIYETDAELDCWHECNSLTRLLEYCFGQSQHMFWLKNKKIK